MPYPIDKSEPEWKAVLRAKGAEPSAFEVTRHAATEPAHTGRYAEHFAPGRYHCICCNKALFTSDAKFDAGCGWPSFDQTITENAVAERVDRSHGMLRTEALCPDCGAHLGHLFDDGPTETGLRYCMNSASLHFVAQ
ncbi:MAG: peptide-methionine (R)-S-oxide reductase MsrB [Rhodoferax sp.]|nr:peptide-methionine (R)-S-oxide reductase MsrB [Rhodoferax sp.]